MSCSGQRVLQPVQAAGVVEGAAHADGVGAVPARQGHHVDDHLDVRADGRTYLPSDGQVAPLVTPEGDGQVVPPATFHEAIALRHEARELAADAVEVIGGEDGRGAGGHPLAPPPTQQLVERHAGSLARDVPERHVEGADPERHQTTVAVPVGGVAHLLPRAGDVTRIAAQQQRRQPPLDHESRCQRRLLAAGDGLAPTDQTVVGLDADQRQGAYLAVVIGLRVAHREGLDPPDLHVSSASLHSSIL